MPKPPHVQQTSINEVEVTDEADAALPIPISAAAAVAQSHPWDVVDAGSLDAFASDLLAPQVPRPASPEDRATVIATVIRATHGRGVAGWGSHGEAGGTWEWIPLERIVPNPEHPREDWAVEDAALRTLAASMSNGVWGQVDPILVTPLDPAHPSYVPGRCDLMLIKGHRRYAAARLARQDRIKGIVQVDSETGAPLSVPEAILYWLTRTESRKPAGPGSVVMALVDVRWHQDQVDGALAGPGGTAVVSMRQNMDRQKMAANLGVTEATISYAFTIASEPPAIVAYLHERLLRYTHALLLIREVPDRAQREELAGRTAALNHQRKAYGRPLLTGSEILDLLAQEVRDGSLRLPAPRGGITAVRSLLGEDNLDLDENGHVPAARLHISRLLGDAGQSHSVDAGTVAALMLAEGAVLLDALKRAGHVQESPTLKRLLGALTRDDVVQNLMGQLMRPGVLDDEE